MNLSEIPLRIQARFWTKVNIGTPDECWLWTMSTGSHGYGQMGWAEHGEREMKLAHRLAWVLTYGDIPSDMTVDHECRIRRCCNPHHLRLLTNLENATDNGFGRRTHCPRGHAYAGTNLAFQNGGRRCKACVAVHRATRKARLASVA